MQNNSGGGGIYNALELLQRQLTAGGVSEADQGALVARLFGGARSGSTAMMMYNNLPGLAQKTSQIDKNGTTTKLMKDWATYTATADFQLKKLDATVHNLGISFGTDLLPVLAEGVRFTEFLEPQGFGHRAGHRDHGGSRSGHGRLPQASVPLLERCNLHGHPGLPQPDSRAERRGRQPRPDGRGPLNDDGRRYATGRCAA